MQTLSSYLLTCKCDDPLTLQSRADQISSAIEKWLISKKVADPKVEKGTFVSEIRGVEGTFVRKVTDGVLGTITETNLEEPTREDQTFATYIAFGITGGELILYANLYIGTSKNVVAPTSTDPRCPEIIRSVIGLFPDWRLGEYALGDGRCKEVRGADEAGELIAKIKSPIRTLPIVVVSQVDGQAIWYGLASKLAYDLAGVAQVFEIDEEAAWELTTRLGKLHSCYLGAVRLYWPSKLEEEAAPYSTVWTASVLLSNDWDGKEVFRFRTSLRRLMMGTAAISLDPPIVLRQIHTQAARARLEELEAKTNAHSEELEIARLYLSDNDSLREKVREKESQVSTLFARVRELEQALKKALEVGNFQIPREDEGEPKKGETRFYKKTHSKPAYDILVRIADCGHNRWQSADNADKAKKGLERLEGRNNWKSVQHCGSCTGGGVWRVRW
jgi:hypothetical protein